MSMTCRSAASDLYVYLLSVKQPGEECHQGVEGEGVEEACPFVRAEDA